nr:carbonyl reductase [nadph] 3 [Quercus suber]
MALQRVAVVTGANKGIGLAIVRHLALQYPTSSLKSGPFLIYLTARSSERGAAAVDSLTQDPQLQAAKTLTQHGGDTTIRFHALDISAPSSIQDFRAFLHSTHPDGVDVVINNAGIALTGFDASVVSRTLETNYYGSLLATQEFLPLVRDGGRLVNVSSQAGELGSFSDAKREAFRKAARTSVDAVTALMREFQSAVEEGKEGEAGFPSAAYAVSKAGETAVTKVIAMEEEKRGRGVLVNACCPGYTNTEMTRGKGTKTVDEGAKTPLLLALGDIGGRTGGFWATEKEKDCHASLCFEIVTHSVLELTLAGSSVHRIELARRNGVYPEYNRAGHHLCERP